MLHPSVCPFIYPHSLHTFFHLSIWITCQHNKVDKLLWLRLQVCYPHHGYVLHDLCGTFLNFDIGSWSNYFVSIITLPGILGSFQILLRYVLYINISDTSTVFDLFGHFKLCQCQLTLSTYLVNLPMSNYSLKNILDLFETLQRYFPSQYLDLSVTS